MEPYKRSPIMALSERLVASYHQCTGWDLVIGSNVAYALYHAPFAITLMGAEADPLIAYANQAALDVWETTWEQFIGTPARLNASDLPAVQEPRARSLEEARRKGWMVHYTGERVSRTGTRFEILNTVLWSVTDPQGHYMGQGARIGAWRYL